MGKSKVQITGGMSPTFISRIAKSKGVSSVLESEYRGVKERLEAKARAIDPLEGKRVGKYHYGSRQLKGRWGNTWVLWPITQTAKKNERWIRSAISRAKNITKKR